MLRLLITLAAIAVASAGTLAQAQQFRVYTVVERLTGDSAEMKAEVVARSVTLFHARKVYDWIPSVSEVTVYEPAQERFVIYNGKHEISTTASFDEIQRLLDSARDETRNFAMRLKERSDREAQTIAGPLLFQLAPKFEEKFEPTSHKLTLSSPRFGYSVECSQPAIPEALPAYLDFADWAARLNHVLHPHSLYPEPRLQLNQALRTHQQIPSKVELRVDFDRPLHLQATHRFDWVLSSKDRQDINHWETLLKSPKTKEVSFRDYQRTVVMGSAQAKK